MSATVTRASCAMRGDVHGIREEDLPARMYLHVVERVELPSEEVVQQHRSVIGWLRVDEGDGRRERTTSRIDKENIPVDGSCRAVGRLYRLG